MAEKIDFELNFANNQSSLRAVKDEIGRILKKVDIDVSANVKNVNTGQGLQSKTSASSAQIDKATQNFLNAIVDRTIAEERIKNIVDNTTRYTKEDNEAIQRLAIARKSAERKIKEVITSEDELNKVLSNIRNVFFIAGRELKEGTADSVDKLQSGIGSNVSSLEELRFIFRAQGEAQNKFIRATDSAVNVFSFTEGVLERLNQDVLAFSRPLQNLSTKSSFLELQFGSAGTTLKNTIEDFKSIGSVARQRIDIGDFRQAVAKAGGDIVETISQLTGLPKEFIETQDIFRKAIQEVSSELKNASSAENALIKANKQLAVSRESEAKRTEANLRGSLNQSIKEQEKRALEAVVTSAGTLSDRANILALQFGRTGTNLRKFLEKLTGKDIGIDDFRSAVKESGGNLEQVVSQFSNIPVEFISSNKLFKDAIKRFTDELANAQKSETELAKANRVAARQLESDSRNNQSDLKKALNDAKKEYEKEVKLERQIVNSRRRFLDEQDALAQLLQREFSLQQRRISEVESRDRGFFQKLFRAQQDEIKASNDAARAARERAKGSSSGGAGGLRLTTPQQIQSFAKNIDTKGLERFVSILKNTEDGLRKANVQLKGHQGNIAKSSVLTDKLTQDLNSGQKAAFQFGFAAASAAERLAAWASPAAFIFQALNLLRQSVDQIVKIDSTFRRIAFFDRNTLNNISAGIRDLGSATFDAQRSAESAAGAFGELSSQQDRLRALSVTQAQNFQLLSARAQETGLAFEQVAELALTASRVGQDAFNFDANTGEATVSNFFRAAEAAVRLEGSAANATTIVAQLNSVLNQFGREGEDALAVVSLIADATGESAFSFQELLDVLSRTGGSFRALQGSGPAEAIEAIRFFSERATVSVGQVSTAIRQLSTGVVRAREEFGLFEDVAEIDREGITSFEGLLKVLEQINSFKGTPELESFLSLFSERRIQANIINFAEGSDKLRENLDALSDSTQRQVIVQAAINNLLAETAFQAESAEAEITRFNNQLTLFGKAARFDDLKGSLAEFGTQGLSAITAVVDALGGIAPIFALIAGAATPALRQIVLGFKAGLIASQNQQVVIGQITQSLQAEGNVIKAINLAEKERIITAKEANKLRAQGISILSQQIPIETTLKQLKQEEVILERAGEAGATQLAAVKTRINALEQQRLNLLREQGVLEANISSTVATQANNLKGSFARKLPSIIGGAALLGGTLAADAVGSAFTNNKQLSNQISSGLQSALIGGVTGFTVGGPIGALAGVGVGIFGAVASARQESAAAAEREKDAQRLANQGALQQLRILNAQNAEREERNKKASETEKQILKIQQQQQLTQIEIQRIGQEKAQEQGLLTELADLEVQLSQARVSLGREEQAQLEAKLKFEKSIVAIKERQQLLEQTISAVREAQVELLQREGEFETVARVKFEFDELNLKARRKALEDELSNVQIRLQQIQGLGGQDNQQELRSLNRERERLAVKINAIEVQTLQTRFKNQLEILKASERQASTNIQRFRQAGDAVAKAVSDSIKLQGGIADAIRKQGEFVSDILEVQLERAERALESSGAGISEEASIEKQIALQRAFLRQQISGLDKIFNKQQKALTDVTSIDEIEDQVDSVISGLNRFEDAQNNAVKSDDIRLQEKEAIFNREQSLLQNRISAIQNEINIRRQDAQARIDIRRRQIEVEERALEAVKKRAELEEQTADKLLDAPDELLRSARNAFNARNFIQAISGRAERQDAELRGLLRDQARGRGVDSAELANVREQAFVRQLRDVISRGGVGNRAVLQQVRDGLQELANQNIKVLDGFSPEDLLSVFKRSLLGDADEINGQIKEQENTNAKIDNLLSLISRQLGEQGRLSELEQQLLAQQSRIADEQKRLNEDQVTELRQQVATSISNSNKLAEEFKNSGANILQLKDQLTSIIEKTGGISEGEREIKSSVDIVSGILQDIADADPQVNEFRSLKSEFLNLSRQLASGGGSFAPSSGGVFDTALSKLQVEANKLLAANNQGPIRNPEAFNDLIGGAITSALLSGNVGKVSGLVKNNQDIGNNFSTEDFKQISSLLGTSANELANLIDSFDAKTLISEIRTSPAAESGLSGTALGVEALRDISNEILGNILSDKSASIRLDEIKNLLGDRASSVESEFLNEQSRTSNEQSRIMEQQRDATLEAVRDNVKTRAQLESLLSFIEQSVNQGAANIENNQSTLNAINTLAERRGAGENVQIEDSKISQESIFELKSSIDTAFGEAIERFKFATQEALANPLSVNFGEIVVNLNAQILQNIQGEEFATQIATALVGTGLEDRVEVIQDILSALVQTELERGNTSLPTSALDGPSGE